MKAEKRRFPRCLQVGARRAHRGASANEVREAGRALCVCKTYREAVV